MRGRGGRAEESGDALLAQAHQMLTWWHRVRDGTLSRSSFRSSMSPGRREGERRLEAGSMWGGAQGRDLDRPLGQAQCVGRQTNAPGRGELLHAGGQMRGLANGRIVHVQVVANGAYHHFTRVEADADLTPTPWVRRTSAL